MISVSWLKISGKLCISFFQGLIYKVHGAAPFTIDNIEIIFINYKKLSKIFVSI